MTATSFNRNVRQRGRRPTAPANSGFTLVELLVVIAIIGVLIALLLPAVQAAREAARRAQCSNNFRQVAIACHAYHSAVLTFPSGVIAWGNPGEDKCAVPPGDSSWYYGWGWGTHILPYLEQSPIYALFDFQRYDGSAIVRGPNYLPTTYVISSYVCPSDPQDAATLISCCTDRYVPAILQYKATHRGLSEYEDMAKSNMAGVADSRNWTCNGSWARPDGNGILFNRSAIGTHHITDGTSNTLLVGEVIGGGQGTFDAYYWVSDDIMDTHNGLNLPIRLPPRSLWDPTGTSFASYHPGGCFFAFADGSAKFLSEAISAYVLAAITTRAGGEEVTYDGP